MHGAESTNANRSKVPTAGFRRDGEAATISGKILPPYWSFAYIVARIWLPPLVPAKQVEFLTRAPERTCRAWCAGDCEPPGWVVIAVLASDDGERALTVLMGDFGAGWWRNLMRAKQIVAAIDPIYSRVEQPGSSRGS